LLLAPGRAGAQETERLEGEARRAFDTGRFREAGEKYARAASDRSLPADRQADLHLQSAWSHYIAGNSKAAREQFRAAFGARPDLQVLSDFYSPDFARLARVVRAEVAGPGETSEEATRAARAKLAQGDAEGAVAALARVESSSDPQVHRLLADAYDRLGRGTDADVARARASDLEKGLITSAPIGAAPVSTGAAPAPAADITPLLEAAARALSAGNPAEAASAARRAAETDPRSAEAHRLLAEAALATGEAADAEREFTAVLVLDSGNARAEFGLARLAENQQKWSTAASHYRRALELDPKNVEAARGLGRSMKEVGDSTAARLAFGRATEMDPGNAAARNDLGVFLFDSGDAERAIAELIEAVRLETGRGAYHENLGRAYAKKGMGREAERELSEAARLSPEDAAIWTALGAVRLELGNAQEAAEAYQAAVRLEAKNLEAAAGLGSALAQAGRLPEAEIALTAAIEDNPDSALLWNDLGVVRVRRGGYAGAVEAFRKAASLDPRLDGPRKNLERAEKLDALERAAS
jgi:Flp pilus assembly protein TadD